MPGDQENKKPHFPGGFRGFLERCLRKRHLFDNAAQRLLLFDKEAVGEGTPAIKHP